MRNQPGNASKKDVTQAVSVKEIAAKWRILRKPMFKGR